jgi:ATP-dependent Clp endopeptidase proteolytic subunit ClpP
MPETTWQERDWYRVRAEAGSAEVLIYDRIGEGLFSDGVTAKAFVAALAALDVPRITVGINSPGGSVFDGLAIFNALRNHRAAVTTRVDGLAASIASVIALAGDEVRMADNALLMIHNPWSVLAGDAKMLRAEADVLDKVRDTMLGVYAERGMPRDEAAAAMDAETWYSAEEALAAGLVDVVAGASQAAAMYADDVGVFARTTPPTIIEPTPREGTMQTIEQQTPDLGPLTERIDQLEARVMQPAPQPAAARTSPRDLFAALVTRFGSDPSARSIQAADMVSGGNPGLTDTGRTSQEIIEYFDAHRYFLSHVASLPFPESGITHTLPRKTQRTQVGQAAEKAAPPSRTPLTDTVQFTGVWYKGTLDISYELIRTSTPGAVQVAVADMLEEAAVESEVEFVSAVEAAAVYLAPLDFTTYKAFTKSVRAAVRAVRAAAGKGQPKFAITSDNWDELLTFTDTTDRRGLAVLGSSNADGSAPLTSEELSLAGITFFESPHSTVDVAFNDNALMRSELPPLQLAADNVPLVGRDVAVLGNVMAVPRIPAGVVQLATDPGQRSRGK